MVVIATDDFNRANNTTLGANWTDDSPVPATDKFNISSNTAVPSSQNNDTLAHWTANAFPNDHYSKATLSCTGGLNSDLDGPGLAARTTDYNNFYRLEVSHAATGNIGLDKFVSSSFTNIVTLTQSWTNGDTWELDVQGTTIKVLRNGSTVTTQTDSALSSGSAGIAYSSNHNTSADAIDNWEGGDFTSGTAVIVTPARTLRGAGI